jgi:ElaB/YqjD/DUF883 family membrane-anchored ribosome-binding protein
MEAGWQDAESKTPDVAGAVQDRVAQTAEHARETVSDLTSRVQDSVSGATHRVQETVSQWGARTGDYARGMVSSCQSLIQERPLAAGAVALGLGALVGLLVPGAYRENQILGDARDRFVNTVEDMAEDLATRAQIESRRGDRYGNGRGAESGLDSLILPCRVLPVAPRRDGVWVWEGRVHRQSGHGPRQRVMCGLRDTLSPGISFLVARASVGGRKDDLSVC